MPQSDFWPFTKVKQEDNHGLDGKSLLLVILKYYTDADQQINNLTQKSIRTPWRGWRGEEETYIYLAVDGKILMMIKDIFEQIATWKFEPKKFLV